MTREKTKSGGERRCDLQREPSTAKKSNLHANSTQERWKRVLTTKESQKRSEKESHKNRQTPHIEGTPNPLQGRGPKGQEKTDFEVIHRRKQVSTRKRARDGNSLPKSRNVIQ